MKQKVLIADAPFAENAALAHVLSERGLEVVKDLDPQIEKINGLGGDERYVMTLSAMPEPQCNGYYPLIKKKEPWRGGRPR